jgi:hypothetical protein
VEDFQVLAVRIAEERERSCGVDGPEEVGARTLAIICQAEMLDFAKLQGVILAGWDKGNR